jgi:hypothetical protein
MDRRAVRRGAFQVRRYAKEIKLRPRCGIQHRDALRLFNEQIQKIVIVPRPATQRRKSWVIRLCLVDDANSTLSGVVQASVFYRRHNSHREAAALL